MHGSSHCHISYLRNTDRSIMPCRKDKYEPKNPEKIQYAYEEEVIASKENAEEEKYTEDTELADGEYAYPRLGA